MGAREVAHTDVSNNRTRRCSPVRKLASVLAAQFLDMFRTRRCTEVL